MLVIILGGVVPADSNSGLLLGGALIAELGGASLAGGALQLHRPIGGRFGFYGFYYFKLFSTILKAIPKCCCKFSPSAPHYVKFRLLKFFYGDDRKELFTGKF